MEANAPDRFRQATPAECRDAASGGKSRAMTMMTAGEAAANTNNVTNDNADDLMRIGEMAKKFGVTLRALRFYEDKGLLNPKRDGATRLYTRRDRARLKLILLGRKVGFSLREVKQMIDLYDPAGSNVRQLRLTLDKSEKQLVRLQKQRALIDDAISELTTMMNAVRQMLSERLPAQSSAAN
jgi:DNA-binding transcriptional MerR regulator